MNEFRFKNANLLNSGAKYYVIRQATALLINDEDLQTNEISDLFDGCPGGVGADDTYGGRTLILAHAAGPLCGRFSAKMRIKRNSRTR